MKLIITLISIITIIASCQSSDVKKKPLAKKAVALDTTTFTTIKWIDSLKDIGTVPAGETAEIKFKFQNTGEKPLIIVEAKPGCGCTLADYPKEPIAPGKQGVITANYKVDKDGQGEFRKNVRVTTNTKGNTDTYIFFYGKIKSSADSASKKK